MLFLACRHIQHFWGASGDFWQERWRWVLHVTGEDEFLLYVIGKFLNIGNERSLLQSSAAHVIALGIAKWQWTVLLHRFLSLTCNMYVLDLQTIINLRAKFSLWVLREAKVGRGIQFCESCVCIVLIDVYKKVYKAKFFVGLEEVSLLFMSLMSCASSAGGNFRFFNFSPKEGARIWKLE